jgi:RluA family pseudouridine synthase
MKLNIIHEDDELILIDKAAGLLSVPDRHDPEVPSLIKLVSSRVKQDVLPVHRLDRLTSGLLLFAKSTDAQRHLSLQFERRTIEKVYLALVEGRPVKPEGQIEAAIAVHPTKAGRMMISTKGKPSISRYRVIDFFGDYSLLEVDLLTGRTHQIRIHLQHIGHPLLVDPFYGNRSELLLSKLKGRKFNLKKGTEERPLLDRVPLHAHRLGFVHPSQEKRLTFTSELPKDIAASINQLKKLG